MKQTLIKILKEDGNYQEEVNILDCIFYSCGTLVYIPKDSYEEGTKNFVYSKNEWEFIKKNVIFQQSTYSAYIEKLKLEDKFYEERKKFVYDNTYKLSFDTNKRSEFAKAYDIANGHKEPKIYEDFKNSPGAAYLWKVTQKYYTEGDTYSCVNKFELEPYGFITSELIEECMCTIDYNKKRDTFENSIRERLGLKVH